jgi:hypothetical protein
MVINSYRNKPLGPGGSTRRLHHSHLLANGDYARQLFRKKQREGQPLQVALMGAK